MRVSVHILTKDRPVELYGLLVSLLNQTYDDWDLAIVDESANPVMNAFPSIKTLFAGIKLAGHNLIYQHNILSKGIAAARNDAIKLDNMNDWCCRIDDDSILDKDYLFLLIDSITKGVGAIGGLVPTFGVPMLKRNINILNDNE